MNAQRGVLLASAVMLLAGCDLAIDGKPDAASAGAAAGDEREFETPAERRYALFADQFASALAQKNYEAAWKLGSSHLRSRMTAEKLALAENESVAKFGQPVKALPAGSVTTERENLVNPADIADPADRLSAARSVGEIPATVPVKLRRASVQIDLLRDGKTIPGYKADESAEDQSDEDDAPRSYLTVVLVEENGQLGVAHYWHRWPDVWD